MLKVPKKAANYGLGPRTFKRGSSATAEFDASWEDCPQAKRSCTEVGDFSSFKHFQMKSVACGMCSERVVMNVFGVELIGVVDKVSSHWFVTNSGLSFCYVVILERIEEESQRGYSYVGKICAFGTQLLIYLSLMMTLFVAQLEEMPSVTNPIPFPWFRFAAETIQAFHSSRVGELIPDLFREDRTLTFLSDGHHNTSSSISPRGRISHPSHKGID